MSSPSIQGGAGAPEKARAVRPLLDAAFGFFVWAAHFLTIYIATAVACQLGLGATGAANRAAFLTALELVTVAAVAVVVLHAFRRYRQQRAVPERRFRMSVTIGCDAIATVAMAGQLVAIALVPACA